MRTDAFARRCGLSALLLGLALTTAPAVAQTDAPPPPSGVSYDAPPADADAATQAPEGSRSRRSGSRGSLHPYLEFSQVVSAELDGEMVTYSRVAAGIDGRIESRRVTAQLSYRYDRFIEWENSTGDADIHSGIAAVNFQVVPGALQFDAGALATRTGGEGRAVGVTNFDQSIEVYSLYAGPTLSTHAGAVAINAAYRLGYVEIDDDSVTTGPTDGFESATAHSATASIGMAPGELPFGWTIGLGYASTDSDNFFDNEFEGFYVRGDIVVPVSATFALTAGLGYENLQADQLDLLRDPVTGLPVVNPLGQLVPDPTRPRLTTYDVEGEMYDVGFIWRPSPRTEVQARAGYRYGGTTLVGSVTHQFNPSTGFNLTVVDSVQTFAGNLSTNLSSLPNTFNITRDPLTGNITCAIGTAPGTGSCIDQSLQTISGNSFRLRGVSALLSGNRGLWSWSAGVGYGHRDYARPGDPAFNPLGGNEDENFGFFGTFNRSLSRDSDVNLNAYATWFDSDRVNFQQVFNTGATLSYTQSLFVERLRFLAALGLYHSDFGLTDSTVISWMAGVRYTF